MTLVAKNNIGNDEYEFIINYKVPEGYELVAFDQKQIEEGNSIPTEPPSGADRYVTGESGNGQIQSVLGPIPEDVFIAVWEAYAVLPSGEINKPWNEIDESEKIFLLAPF